jgi:hypothetical protein
MEIKVTNPGQREIDIDIDIDFSVSESDDPREASSAEMTVLRSTPIQQFAKVVMKNANDIIFRGYVERYTLEGQKKTLSMKSMENVLAYRYTPRYNWCFNTIPSLHNVLGDTLSGTTTTGVGLLVQAQSALPPNTEYELVDETNNIIKIVGAGYKSVIGSRDIYNLSKNGAIRYTRTFDIDDLLTTPGEYFSDMYDLYVRPPVDALVPSYYKYPHRGQLLAEYAFDCDIRLGDHPTDITLQGGLFEDNFVCIDLIMDIIEANGCVASWRRSADYTYLDYWEA